VLPCSFALTFLGGSDLIWVLLWWFRKFAASLASKGQPERQATATDPGLGADHKKEPVSNGTIDIDLEQYEEAPDVDIDMVFALY
jgi:hypothetical protein